MKKKGTYALTSVRDINFYPKSKRSLSGVVTIVILILLALVAIGIVSVVFFNIIQKSSSGINPDKFTISLSIIRESVKVEGDVVTLKIKRNVGEGDLTSIEFIINNGTDSYSETIPVSMEELEEQTFTVNQNNNIDITSENSTITIVPIIQNKKANLDYGDRAEIYDFKTQTIKVISTSSPSFIKFSSSGDGSSGGPGPTTCSLTSAVWSQTNVVEGTIVNLNLQASNCGSVQFNYTIYEDDVWPLTDALVTSFVSTSLSSTWNAIWMEDGLLQGDPEYYFKVFVINNVPETITSSNQLSVSKSTQCIPTTEICNDGIDNDCDGIIDESDCSSLAPSNYIIENVTGLTSTHALFPVVTIIPSLHVKGVPFIDSDTGARITRISDVGDYNYTTFSPINSPTSKASGFYNGYSTYPDINKNGQYAIVFGTGGDAQITVLYNLSDYSLMKRITARNGYMLGETKGVRWDKSGIPGTETTIYYHVLTSLYKQDVLTGTSSEQLIFDFKNWDANVQSVHYDTYGDFSEDMHYVAVRLCYVGTCGETPQPGDAKVVVLDILNRRVLPGVIQTGSTNGLITDGAKGTDISPDGKWLLLTGYALFYRISDLENNNTNNPVFMPYKNGVSGERVGGGHGAWAYNYDGNVVFVWQSSGSLVNQLASGDDSFHAFNPETGEDFRIIHGSEFNYANTHTARQTNPAKKGWVLVSTYGGSDTSWVKDQFFMLEIKPKYTGNWPNLTPVPDSQAPRVWRIATSHSRRWINGTDIGGYFTETFANIDMIGNNVYWGGNWFGTDNLELYRVELPTNWHEVLAGTIPGPSCTDIDGDKYNVSATGCGIADCNDNNININPGKTEICDGIDNDCDETVDEGCGAPGTISFVTPPTPLDSATIDGNSVEIKTNINGNLKSLDFNWNGNNYPLHDSSLVLSMNFDKVSSLGETDSIVKDLSGKGNNATCSGTACPTWTSSGKYNGAYTYDGSNDRLTITNNPSLVLSGGDFTITAWVKITDYSIRRSIISKRSSLGFPYEFMISQTTGKIGLLTSGGSSYSRSTVSQNEWKHVAVVYKNNGMTTYYIDGEIDESVLSKSSTDVNTNIIIGAEDTSGQYPFKGLIDEVRIYKKALTDNEVKELYYSNLNKYDADKWVFYVNQSNLYSGNYNYKISVEDSSSNLFETETRALTINNPRKIYEIYQGVDIPEWGIYNYSYGANGYQGNYWYGSDGSLASTTTGGFIYLNCMKQDPALWATSATNTGGILYWDLSKVPRNLSIKKAYFGLSGTGYNEVGDHPTGEEGVPIRRINNPFGYPNIWTGAYEINLQGSGEQNWNGASWLNWKEDPAGYYDDGTAYGPYTTAPWSNNPSTAPTTRGKTGDLSSALDLLDINTPRISFDVRGNSGMSTNAPSNVVSYSTDATSIIQGMVDSSIPNYGFMTDTWNANGTIWVGPYQNPSATNWNCLIGLRMGKDPVPSVRPRLIIETY